MAVTARHLARGGAVAAGVFLVFGLVTDLLANPVFVRMVPRTPLDYAFLGATSVLAGAYVVQRDLLRDVPGDGCAFTGTLGGFLAFGCPVCNKLLLALFSSSAIMTYFDPLRPVLGTVNVLLFVGLLYYQRRRCTRC